MLVIKKEKQIKEVDVTVEQHNLCDKCNEKIYIDIYEAFECEFKYKTGNYYPGSGDGILQEMELCKKCSVGFVDLLKEKGYRINESEWSY